LKPQAKIVKTVGMLAKGEKSGIGGRCGVEFGLFTPEFGVILDLIFNDK